MKKPMNVMLFLSLIILGLVSCSKTSTESEMTCNLATSVREAPVSMDIVYTATQTGDGTIATLKYATGDDTITVTKPTLPWTMTISVPSGTPVFITAAGTVKNGSLTIKYTGVSGGNQISSSDYCSQSTN